VQLASRSYNATEASASARAECCRVAIICRHGVHNDGFVTCVASTCTEITEGRADSAWGGFAGC
jgi:hypothetical protein